MSCSISCYLFDIPLYQFARDYSLELVNLACDDDDVSSGSSLQVLGAVLKRHVDDDDVMIW